ncbi:MAG: lipase family protein [Candidatus Binataceae bacterium]
MPWLDSDGVRIHYESSGDDSPLTFAGAIARPEHRRDPIMVVHLFLGMLLMLFVSSCGASGGDSSTPAAPFDAAKGEGDLIGTQLVATYPTSTGASMGLDSFYTKVICDRLDTQDCATNTANLNTPQFGNFDLATNPIGNNAYGIASIDAIKLGYTAINVDGAAVPVTGGLLVPEMNPASIRGLIVFYHGTIVERDLAPSNFPALNTASIFAANVMVAAVWASQGYVVAMPDYIGLGDDTTHVHPYITYPRVNAQSGLAMVKAARTYLTTAYHVTAALPLYLSGFSEGGAYALEAEQLMQKNGRYASELKVSLKKVAPLSGLYDVSGTELPFLFDNITAANNKWFLFDPVEAAISKPYVSAYLMLSFANYSGVPPTEILASSFYTCPSSVSGCGSSGNLNALYFTASQSPGYNLKVALTAFALAPATGWSLTSNSIAPLLTPVYANALQDEDLGNPLYRQAVDANTYLFTPKTPTTLVSLREDSDATRVNSDVAYAYFISKNPSGPYQEQLVDNGNFLAVASSGGSTPIDHLEEVPFLIVLVLNQFNSAN